MPVSRVSCRYPGPRESVHIKLLVSPVSFHTIMYVYSWFIVLTESLLTVRLAVSEIKPPIKYVYMQNVMFVGVSVIEILEFNQKKKKNMAKL